MKLLAVYVHIPFCVVKCGYCDFNTYSGLDRLKPAYQQAMLGEVAAWTPLLSERTITSISFGGGTPGEFPAAGLAAVIRALQDAACSVAPDAEISIEANPGTTSFAELSVLAGAGVNRVSYGAQSFDPGELRFLDRLHSPQAIAASVANARLAGIPSIGIDLIYGLPGQSLAQWRTNLDCAVVLGVDHLSCYALTVEEGTPLAHRIDAGDVPMPDPDIAAEMYEAAEGVLAAAGFRHYEISNWARPGHASRHNSVYWTGGDYLGIGAGAHGFVDGERYENIAHPRTYIDALTRPEPPQRAAICDAYRPSGATAAVDWIEARLRMVDGFPRSEAAFEPAIAEVVDRVLDEAAAMGLVETYSNGGSEWIRLTPRGRLLHTEICARLLSRLG